MSKLVCSFCMSFWENGLPRLKLLMAGLVLAAGVARGQDERKVPISFVPPPLENATYSLGIYEAKSGKLVRRLQEIAPESAFTVGVNGLMTSWDGKDDAGKPVAPGRYAARGYAVGALKVEGVGIRGNDWTSGDESLRPEKILALILVPGFEDLAMLATMADGSTQLLCFRGPEAKLKWRSALPFMELKPSGPPGASMPRLAANNGFISVDPGSGGGIYSVEDGKRFRGEFSQGMAGSSGPVSYGKDRTVWKIEDGVLSQYALTGNPSAAEGEKLRQLTTGPDEPLPVAVSASESGDRLYLLEEKAGWQRVRGLSWVETKQENDKQVSTWQTFFERNIRAADGPAITAGVHAVTIALAENSLTPGKPQNAKLSARKDGNGGYLTDADGLGLRRISENPNLRWVILQKAGPANRLAYFQYDGAVWDEFSIEGARNIMAFDAGEIEMTANGEKAHPAKATAEPPDL